MNDYEVTIDQKLQSFSDTLHILEGKLRELEKSQNYRAVSNVRDEKDQLVASVRAFYIADHGGLLDQPYEDSDDEADSLRTEISELEARIAGLETEIQEITNPSGG